MSRRMLVLVLMMVLAVLACAGPALAFNGDWPWPGSNATKISHNPALDARLQAIVDNPARPLASLAVLTVQGGRITYTGNFGYRYIDNANPANNLPVNKFTKFRIASVAKLVTAIAIMQQVERGNIDLDADVSQYLGFTLRNPSFPDVPITTRMLLSHTSSMRDTGGWYGLPEYSLSEFFTPGGVYWNAGKHWATPSAASDRSPGQYFTYCNLGYGTLGTILEAVTGERYYDYMRNHVLRPLGITGDWDVTSFTRREIANVATMYWKQSPEGVWDPAGLWYPHTDDFRGVVPLVPKEAPNGSVGYVPGTNATWQSPMGGFRASTEDLSQIMRMFMNEGRLRGKQILQPATVDLMFAPDWVYNHDPLHPNGSPYYGLMAAYGLGSHIITNTLGDRLLADLDIFMSGHLGGGSTMLSGMMLDRDTGDGFVYILGGLGAYSEDNLGVYSAFYIWEEEIMTSLFEEQLLK